MAGSALGTDYQTFMNQRFAAPDRYEHINDYIGLIRIATRVELRLRLQALEKHNGTQIVFLSVPNIGNESPEIYAREVFKKWDIGNNQQNNGVLFLASPQGAYIMTGAGIGGALPDVKIARAFREIILPAWERDMFSEGAEAGIDALIEACMGEPTMPTSYDYLHPLVSQKPEHILAAILAGIGLAYAGVVLWRRIRKKKLQSK